MKLAVIHFFDLAKYPPAMNLVKLLASGENAPELIVYTRSETAAIDGVKIIRYPLKEKSGKVARMAGYLSFYLKVFRKLASTAPDTVLYYETLSFPAVYLYLLWNRLRGRKVRVFCHYHEYTSPQEYITTMKLNGMSHALERRSYQHFSWISHTNQDRMRLFLKDIGQRPDQRHHIYPNYPPRSWQQQENSRTQIPPVRLVYVGALDFSTTYIREISTWVNTQEEYTLDVYSGQYSPELEAFFASLDQSRVKFHKGVSYYELPNVLKDKHIGLILYKGHILNYVYNEPNKFFEYLVNGLNVWYPKEMEGLKKWRSGGIIEVDFAGSIPALVPEQLSADLSALSCENASKEIINQLFFFNRKGHKELRKEH
ncbi:MAG: hypothetical protein V4616_06450 [Bacteroidota bacterium]